MSIQALIIHPPKFALSNDGDGNLQIRIEAHNHPADGLTLRLSRAIVKDFYRALIRARLFTTRNTFILADGVTMVVFGTMLDMPEGRVAGVQWEILSESHPWKKLPFRFPNSACEKLEKYFAEKGGIAP